jgi:GAF domain-containing protein
VRAERLARGRVDLLRRTAAALAAAVTAEDVAAAAMSDPELGATAAAIYPRADAPPVAAAAAHTGPPIDRMLTTPPVAGGPVAQALESGTAVFREEIPPGTAVSVAGLAADGRSPSAAVLPLRTPEGQSGVMLLTFARPRGFTADDRDLLSALADQTAQALDRALRHEAERMRRRRAEMLEHLTTALEREMTVSARAGLATRLLVPDLADYATLEAASDDGTGAVVLGLSHRDPEMEPLLRSLRQEHRLDRDAEHSMLRTLETGRPMLIERVPQELIEHYSAREGVGDKLRRLGPRSHLALPLRARGHMVAALMLGRSDPRRPPFRPEDVAFAAEIASRLGVAIDNAALYEQQREIALGLQLSLLPEAVPQMEDARLAVRYQPGQHHMEVGGDWYDAFRLPDGRLALAVGDVVGRWGGCARRSRPWHRAPTAPPRPCACWTRSPRPSPTVT